MRSFDVQDRDEDVADTEDRLTATQIDEVVHQLNAICRVSSLEFALRVGAVIIHHFYGGNMEAWRSRGPKLTSFRRLAVHPQLPLSAGALYRCVAVFELCERLRAPSRWRRLGASHLRAVIGVPMAQQEWLLARANEERWTVQVLQAKAQMLRDAPARGGRRAQSMLGKRLRALERCLQGCGGVLDDATAHALEELDASLELLERMRSAIGEITQSVKLARMRLAPGD